MLQTVLAPKENATLNPKRRKQIQVTASKRISNSCFISLDLISKSCFKKRRALNDSASFRFKLSC